MSKYPTGDFQNEVLRAILIKSGTSYVTEINRYLEKKLDRLLLTPQIQVALKRLEQRGFVTLLRQEKSEKGGRPKNIYGLTTQGRERVAALQGEESQSHNTETEEGLAPI